MHLEVHISLNFINFVSIFYQQLHFNDSDKAVKGFIVLCTFFFCRETGSSSRTRSHRDWFSIDKTIMEASLRRK